MVCVLMICLDEFTTPSPFACWPVVVALTMLSVSFPIVKTLCTIIYRIENNQREKKKQIGGPTEASDARLFVRLMIEVALHFLIFNIFLFFFLLVSILYLVISDLVVSRKQHNTILVIIRRANKKCCPEQTSRDIDTHWIFHIFMLWVSVFFPFCTCHHRTTKLG